MEAAWRRPILNDTISSKVFSKSLRIYISKGEKLLSFHSVSTPPPPLPVLLLKVTFISKNVFFRVYVKVGLSQSDVTSACVFLGRLWKRPWETSQAQIGGFHVNDCWFKQFSERFWERREYPGVNFHILELLIHLFKDPILCRIHFNNVFWPYNASPSCQWTPPEMR